MTKVDAGTATVADVLGAVQELAPAIAGRAREIEVARRLPADLLAELVRAGCFRLVRPPSLGGIGAEAPAMFSVLEALARADASTAWTVMIGGGSWLDLAGMPARASMRCSPTPTPSRPASSTRAGRSHRPTAATG